MFQSLPLARTILLALLLVGCQLTPMDPPTLMPVGPAIAPEQELMVMVQLADGASLEAVEQEFVESHPVRTVAMWPMHSVGLFCMVFTALPGTDRDELVAAFADDDRVVIAQPMQVFGTALEGLPYNDPLLPLQRGLRTLGISDLQGSVTGAGVRVAVIDTGIDAEHPDLRSRVTALRDFTGTTPADSPEEHGTAMAGVIAATGNNGVGVVGVAPGAELLGLRGCYEPENGEGGICTSFTLALALNVAILRSADVINLSLAGPEDPTLSQLLDAAADRGLSIVAAAAGGDAGVFPASHPAVIAVASETDVTASTLRAPGADVLTTAPGGRWDYVQGSSVAAAHVSGLVALLREADPNLSAGQISAELNGLSEPDFCAVLVGAGSLQAANLCPQQSVQRSNTEPAEAS